MAAAVCRLPTAHASRYLQQLCKHWGHKFPVEFKPETGRIELSAGILVLDADEQGLGVRLTADAAQLTRMEAVVADHLQRFAFRETLTFQWAEPA